MLRALLITLVLSHGTDVGTSLAVFHAGGVEVNPLVLSSKPAPFVLQASLLTTGEIIVLRRVSRRHRRWAIALSLIDITASVAASVHNIQQLHVQQRLNRGGA